MATGTVRGRVGEIGHGPRVGVTLGTGQFRVLPGQLERELVPEVCPKPIHAIMTCQTVRAVFDGMGLGEGRAHLTVAGLAGVGSERGDVAEMTVIAGERFAPRRTLMRRE